MNIIEDWANNNNISINKKNWILILKDLDNTNDNIKITQLKNKYKYLEMRLIIYWSNESFIYYKKKISWLYQKK